MTKCFLLVSSEIGPVVCYSFSGDHEVASQLGQGKKEKDSKKGTLVSYFILF